jgi:hypothetical protein
LKFLAWFDQAPLGCQILTNSKEGKIAAGRHSNEKRMRGKDIDIIAVFFIFGRTNLLWYRD